MWDGAETLDDVIARLQHQITYISDLKREGWELEAPVESDYGFLKKTNKPSRQERRRRERERARQVKEPLPELLRPYQRCKAAFVFRQ